MDETERERFSEGSKFKLTVPFMVKCLFLRRISALLLIEKKTNSFQRLKK
jgi:hypothetical protein